MQWWALMFCRHFYFNKRCIFCLRHSTPGVRWDNLLKICTLSVRGWEIGRTRTLHIAENQDSFTSNRIGWKKTFWMECTIRISLCSLCMTLVPLVRLKVLFKLGERCEKMQSLALVPVKGSARTRVDLQWNYCMYF